MINRSITIKFSVSTDILLDYKDIGGNTLFDTNRYGEYARIFYRILATPVGMTEEQLTNADPEVLLILEIQGRVFPISQLIHEIAKEELYKIKGFLATDAGRKSLKPAGTFWPKLDIADIPITLS